MADVFISYAHTTAKQAQGAASALRALGYSVWLDDDLASDRPYTHAIEEQLVSAKAALVIWSADAAKSEWVLSEANRAREDRKLVQLAVDKARLPMPFDQVQCADLAGWSGEGEHANWRKVAASIGELVGAPSGLGAVPVPPMPLPSKPSIAVLPFANLSNDPDQDYFADGMMEEVVAALTRFKSLFVIASGSTLSFKGRVVSPKEVARQLGVRYVLEGSVRRAGDHVRIAVKLIDPTDGSQVWAERFDGTLDDVFALQDKVALSVAGTIEPTIRAAEIRRVSKRPTENMNSYDLVLRAAPLRNTWKAAENLEALELLDQAIALDAGYAAALASAAVCHSMLAAFFSSKDRQWRLEQSQALAARALQADPDDAEVLSLIALALANVRRDLEGPIAIIDRALALNPGSSLAWYTSGTLRAKIGEPELSIEHLETSMRLDPLSVIRFGQLAWLGVDRFEQGRLADAVPLLRQSIELMPPFPIARAVLLACLGHLGETVAVREAVAHQADDPWDAARAMASSFRRVEEQTLLLDGIALAAGMV